MTVLQALVLGFVQGITEMLPISSSGHLVLLPWFFRLPDQGLSFDVALHMGTLLALVSYFWKDWLKIFHDFFLILKTRKIETFEQKLAGFLVLATIPGVIGGFLLENYTETIFRSPYVIVFNLVFWGLILLLVDTYSKKSLDLKKMSIKKSLFIGTAQVLALIPGTSRSGVTMTAGLASGLKREEAARFSFLMSAPIIAGAGLLKVPEINVAEVGAINLLIGLVAAAVSSFIAIRFLLGFVKKNSFRVFSYYRFILATIIILFMYFRG